MAGEYCNANEAGSILGVSGKTITRAIKKGLIPAIKLGRVYRIHRPTVERMAQEGGLPPVGAIAGDGDDGDAMALLDRADALIQRARAQMRPAEGHDD